MTTIATKDLTRAARRDVAAYQDEALRRQLSYVATRSPFYRDKFDRAGVSASDITCVADLQRLPFTEKTELRVSQSSHPPLGSHMAADPVDVVRVHASSGTTGKPSYIGITARDADGWAEVASRVYACQGVTPEDTVLHGLALGFFVGGLPIAEGVQRLGATFVPVGTGATDRLLQAARDLSGTVLLATPSFARYLAEHMRGKLGVDPSTLGVRRILLGAEPGGSIPAVRGEIEHNFGATVLESLGNSDVMPVYAAMCDERHGNHLLAEDHVVFEIIDPASGEVLGWEDGMEGELVTTHLDRECVPMVRFRTRDRVVVTNRPCSCGRTAPRLTCIGRTDDLLIVNGVNVWPSAISDVVASFSPRTTGALEIVVDGPLPNIQPPVRVRVEAAQGQATDDLRASLEAQLRARLIARCAVELLEPDTLARTEGKTRLVRVESSRRPS